MAETDPKSATLNAVVNGIVAKAAAAPLEQKLAVIEAEIAKIEDSATRLSVEALVNYCIETGRRLGEQTPAPRPRSFLTWRYGKIAIGIGVVCLLGVVLIKVMGFIADTHVIVPDSHFIEPHGTNRKLIVFVHGVIGDMDNTWKNAKTGNSWPELMRSDPAFTDYDVFVYGYSSPLFGHASAIDQVADRFGQQLKDWKMFDNYDEIDFITHSMGGLITKAVLDALNTPSEIEHLRRVHCVIYIAVPSKGASLADLQSWLSQNPQFRSMSIDAASSFLRTIDNEWENLLNARSHVSPFPRTFVAYETVPTYGMKVVPELYVSDRSDLPVMAFDYNHIDIVKPPDRRSDVYVWASSRILESDKIVSTAPVPSPNRRRTPKTKNKPVPTVSPKPVVLKHSPGVLFHQSATRYHRRDVKHHQRNLPPFAEGLWHPQCVFRTKPISVPG